MAAWLASVSTFTFAKRWWNIYDRDVTGRYHGLFPPLLIEGKGPGNDVGKIMIWGAYHLTEKSRWGVESIMVKDLLVHRRIAISVMFWMKKRANLCSVSLEPRRNRQMVNGKQHSVWFVPTGMNGLAPNVLLNFRLEFPESDLTIYRPSGISEIFC